MAQFIDGRTVLLNARGFLRGKETLILSDAPFLSVVVQEAFPTPKIEIVPFGVGFQISLNGFSPGSDLTSSSTGVLSGRSFEMTTVAARFVEFSQGAIYRVECFMVEA